MYVRISSWGVELPLPLNMGLAVINEKFMWHAE
jgi:hypothetical protein